MKLDLTITVKEAKVRIYSYHDISDPLNDNIDIFVSVGCSVYGGTVISLENVRQLMMKPDLPDYFYVSYSIVISILTPETISNAVREMIEENALEHIFCKQVD